MNESAVSAQGLIAALLVLGCCVYAVWNLMPAVARRALARRSLRLPLPSALTARLRRVANASAGCGCDGCDRSEVKAAGPATNSPQPITFHPRR